MRKFFVLAALVLTAYGCASAGIQVKPEQLTSLRPGITTVGDVISRFGSPTGRAISSDGSTTLTYVYSHTQVRPETFIPYVGAFVGGADTQSNAVSLKFGPDGKLLEYSSSDSTIGAGVGFAAGNPQSRTAQPTTVKPATMPESPAVANQAVATEPSPPAVQAQMNSSPPQSDPVLDEIKSKGSTSAKVKAAADLCNQGKISKEERNRLQAAILRGEM